MFKPKLSIFRKRREFELLKQGEETINEWYVKIIGNSLKERVKDKFVVGLKAGSIFEKLCEEKPSRSLEELVEIAGTKEATLKESRCVEVNKLTAMKKPQGSNRVRLERFKSSNVEKLCFHCNKPDHNFKYCRFKNFKCKKCKRKGHIAEACKFKVDNFSTEGVCRDV